MSEQNLFPQNAVESSDDEISPDELTSDELETIAGGDNNCPNYSNCHQN